MSKNSIYIFVYFVYFENGSKDFDETNFIKSFEDEKAIWLGLVHDKFNLNRYFLN